MGEKVILVGIDGSDAAQHALEWAITEAASLGWPIRLVGAYSIPSVASTAIDVSYVPIDDETIRNGVQSVLREAAEQVRAGGIEVEALIEVGDAAGVLVEQSKSAGLAVVGSRGRGGFAGRMLGNVSSALPAHSSCPTAIIPLNWKPDERREARERSSAIAVSWSDESAAPAEGSDDDHLLDFSGYIVVGVDALGRQSPSLWTAASVAARKRMPLMLIGVLTTSVVGPEWLPARADMERYQHECTEGLDRCVASLKEKHPELDAHWQLFDGSPAEVLVRASETAEMLVVGSRGRGGFTGLLLGSTSQAVLHHSKCPTVVVHVTKESEAHPAEC
ncbi:universal stress protein [Saxibacter everestensis]|uniref:Universal stress protein n=1 Tax=Saxibacter everestensis TaxID=2909229 RepID=A0ABY8QWS3_9MICO|nr:universal stress protein [Brevibacteriaceae bacterium ZFBP1038]